MFGYPAYFVNDNLFTALHEDNVILRLSEDDHKDMLSKHADAVQFEPMPGRPMREYVVLPPSLYRDANVFDSWLSRSYQYALLLPPKERKGTRKSNRS